MKHEAKRKAGITDSWMRFRDEQWRLQFSLGEGRLLFQSGSTKKLFLGGLLPPSLELDHVIH